MLDEHQLNSKPEPYMCLGFFFSILAIFKKDGLPSDPNVPSHSNEQLFYELRHIVGYDEDISNEPAVYNKDKMSALKNCRENEPKTSFFRDDKFRSDFDKQIKQNYNALFIYVREYLKYHYDCSEVLFLGNNLIDMILLDSSIEDTDSFYVQDNGVPVSKADIRNIKTFSLESLCLGIFYYIIKRRIGKNKVGRKSYQHFWPKNKGKKYCCMFSNEADKEIVFDSPPVSTILPAENHKTSVMAEPSECIRQIYDKESPIDMYVRKSLDRYSFLENPFFKKLGINLYEFYIPRTIKSDNISFTFAFPDLKFRGDALVIKSKKSGEIINSCNIDHPHDIISSHEKIIITGSFGSGKSVLIRTAFREALNKYQTLGILPILVNVRDYDFEHSLEEWLQRSFTDMIPSIDNGSHNSKFFLNKLINGECVLFFDGIDEARNGRAEEFTNILDNFSYKYENTVMIATSRKLDCLSNLHEFSEFELQELNAEQCSDIIDHVREALHIPNPFGKKTNLVMNFIIYYNDLVKNPMYLTIMSILYWKNNRSFPEPKNELFNHLFDSLLYDATEKKNNLKRKLKIGNDKSRLKDIFREFCYVSLMDGKVGSFKTDDISRYYSQLPSVEKIKDRYCCDDFIIDLTENVHLMANNGLTFDFIHRSFQEYFASVELCKLDTDTAVKKINMFYCNSKDSANRFFDLVYECAPLKTAIELDCLETLFNKSYEDFLLEYIKHFGYSKVENRHIFIEPKDHRLCKIYYSACRTNYLEIDSMSIPDYPKYVNEDNKYYYFDSNKITLLNVSNNILSAREAKYYLPQETLVPENYVGCTYDFDVKTVFDNKEELKELYNYMYSDDGVFKVIYNLLYEHYRHIKGDC